ncbi:hypothetical protein KV205_10815 [Streptomyces sp. SKN60]|uniref:hypothetical protein n=1 Tax=Streptomyces sp. SKN60 TaxID=2855506 RepID=UPI0022460CE6|nr:hypothetical protein [Streptomyces sp. SKN60]MCX2181021.1 hypothetical protein [Streptomyces sp. SKN60]
MAGTWDEQQLIADGFERVYAESDWYDGPRAGLADIGGRPHYFRSDEYDHADEADEYRVWPASEAVVGLEREQWAIFARWNERSEAGEVGPESHPGHGGIDARYDELEQLLAPHRQAPDDARRLVGELRFVEGARYRVDGLDYWIRWRSSR